MLGLDPESTPQQVIAVCGEDFGENHGAGRLTFVLLGVDRGRTTAVVGAWWERRPRCGPARGDSG